MSNETGIHSSDIVSTMLDNNMLKYRDGNYLINKVSLWLYLHCGKMLLVFNRKTWYVLTFCLNFIYMACKRNFVPSG